MSAEWSMVLGILAALAAGSTRAAAQSDTHVYGTRIRIETLDEKHAHEGTFGQLTTDSITFSPGLDTTKQAIPLGRVRRIDVSRPNAGGHSVIKGAAIASGVGLAAIIVIGVACHLGSDETCAPGLYAIGPAMLVAGALIGGLTGAGREGEHWSRVYPPRAPREPADRAVAAQWTLDGREHSLRKGRVELRLLTLTRAALRRLAIRAAPIRDPSRGSAPHACARS